MNILSEAPTVGRKCSNDCRGNPVLYIHSDFQKYLSALKIPVSPQGIPKPQNQPLNLTQQVGSTEANNITQFYKYEMYVKSLTY